MFYLGSHIAGYLFHISNPRHRPSLLCLIKSSSRPAARGLASLAGAGVTSIDLSDHESSQESQASLHRTKSRLNQNLGGALASPLTVSTDEVPDFEPSRECLHTLQSAF